jgi:hypothetical protein
MFMHALFLPHLNRAHYVVNAARRRGEYAALPERNDLLNDGQWAHGVVSEYCPDRQIGSRPDVRYSFGAFRPIDG